MNVVDNKEYVVLVKGEIDFFKFVLVCVYFECFIGDVFYFYCCDCGL